MLIGVLVVHFISGTNGLTGQQVPPGDYFGIGDENGRLLHKDCTFSDEKMGAMLWFTREKAELALLELARIVLGE